MSAAAHPPLPFDGLLEVGRLVRAGGSLGDLHEAMAAAVARSLGFATAVVNLHRRATDDFVVAAVHGDAQVRTALHGATSTWAQWQPLFDAHFDLGGATFVPAGTVAWDDGLPTHVPLRCGGLQHHDGWDPEDALFAPLLDSAGAIAGVLSVDEPLDGRRPTSEEGAALVAFAAHLAGALETRRLVASQARRDQALEHLARVAAAALRIDDPAGSVGPVAEAVRDALGFAVVEVAVAGDGVLGAAAALGDAPRLDGLPLAELAALLEGWPAEEGCHRVPADGAPPGWGPAGRQGAGPGGWRLHGLVVPLTDRAGRLAGALRAGAPRDLEAPPAGVLRLLRAFALQAAAAIDSAGAAAVRRSEARKGAMLASALDAIVTVDADGLLVEFNPAAERTFGVARADVIGTPMADLVVPDRLRHHHSAAFAAELRGEGRGKVVGQRVEVPARRANGEEFPAEIAVVRIDAEGPPQFTAYLRDISDRVADRRALAEQRDRAQHAAHHDALTGLPNRAGAEERLAALAAAGTDVLALRVVLDDLALVTSSLGHAAGDEVLRRVARRLAAEAGSRGFAARLDGAAFLVVRPAGRAEPLHAAASVHRLLRAPVPVAGTPVPVAVSVGVALAGPGDPSADVLRRADIAAERARATATPSVLFAREHDDAAERLGLAAGLRRALDDDELELHFQPLVAVAAPDRPVGFEALLRWRPRGGALVPPGRFIPFAESSGLIEPIGEWVLDAACRQIAAWGGGEEGPVVGVNVSPRQLRRTDVARLVTRALARHGVPPSRLCIELTETALRGAELSTVRETLEALGALGVRTAIDDFGADYSSLRRLRELPVQMVKVDRSFLDDVPGDRRGEDLLAAIAALAGALGLRTVVEGVERPEQLALLGELGVEFAQGFLLGRPAPPGEVVLPARA